MVALVDYGGNPVVLLQETAEHLWLIFRDLKNWKLASEYLLGRHFKTGF